MAELSFGVLTEKNCSTTDTKEPGSSIPGKIHNFPSSLSCFYGRDRELSDLVNSVKKCESIENGYEKMIIISGLEAMGKSEIAKVLAIKLKDQFPCIFWLNAQSKTSLDSSFHQLLRLLKDPFEETYKTPFDLAYQTYHQLIEKQFNKSIFIFDNAKWLKSEPNSSFRLEEYLLPSFKWKKPVFVITTRNNCQKLEHNIKIIHLGELGEEEAKMCFLKYLRLEGLEIPLSLSATIGEVVQIVQGHPLGILLMGTEAARKQDEISFGEVEARISNYLGLLKDQPLEELTEQKKYERNLQIIFDEILRKLLLEEETGRDAAEILSIISLLDPDEIYVGLVNGIFSRKIFYPQKYICESFLLCDLVGELGLRVQRALNLLESNRLIQIESVEISSGIFDFIRIHRLVHTCVKNCNPDLLQPRDTLQLTADFFATNEDNRIFQRHISSILKFLEEYTFSLGDSVVLSLLFERCHIIRYCMNVTTDERAEAGRLLNSREWSAEEKRVVDLIKSFAGIIAVEKSEIKELMLGLSEELIREGWVLQLCTRLLYEYCFKGTDRRTLRNWLRKCYADCPSINRYVDSLLHFMFYGRSDSVFDADDGGFVLKVFSNTSERQRKCFWGEMSTLNFYSGDIFMGLVPYFFPSSGGTNLLVKSLEFLTDELKINFLGSWARYFESCASKLIANKEMREKLLATEEFTQALKDITEFGFNQITGDKFKRAYGISYLLLIWLGIFSAHDVTYKRFGQFVDRLVIDLPESIQSQFSGKCSLVCLGNEGFKDLTLKFTGIDYFSTATKSWIQKYFPDDAYEEDDSSDDCWSSD